LDIAIKLKYDFLNKKTSTIINTNEREMINKKEDKCYIELNLEYVLHSSIKDKDLLIEDINIIISELLGKEDAIHISANINVISEDKMVFPVYGGTQYEN